MDPILLRYSLKEIDTLRTVFTKSNAAITRYKPVMAAFGELFTLVSEPYFDLSEHKRIADKIKDITLEYNQDGDNLDMIHCAQGFSTRIKKFNRLELNELYSKIRTEDNGSFILLLKTHGYYTDKAAEALLKKKREEEQRKREEEERRRREEEQRKREQEERRRREEEERKRRDEEARRRREEEARRLTIQKAAFCTNCGYKFPDSQFDYCIKCGAKRLTFKP